MEIEIRECKTLEQLAECVALQRAVFQLPDIEISPVRHLVVTKNAGGFILGAYAGNDLVGFVLSVPAFLRGQPAIYSHMTGVRADFQGSGIGARLKWEQRERCLADGIKTVKWTFEPWKARNAFFNLEKLGAIVAEYQANFYGVDYATLANTEKNIGLASDRLFAEWELESEKVVEFSNGRSFAEKREAVQKIEVVKDWTALVESNPQAALAEQLRLQTEFEKAFAGGLIGGGFDRDSVTPKYLLYSR